MTNVKRVIGTSLVLEPDESLLSVLHCLGGIPEKWGSVILYFNYHIDIKCVNDGNVM